MILNKKQDFSILLSNVPCFYPDFFGAKHLILTIELFAYLYAEKCFPKLTVKPLLP